MLDDFHIAAMMLPAPVFAFLGSFFVFISEIAFFANVVSFVSFVDFFYHSLPPIIITLFKFNYEINANFVYSKTKILNIR